MKKTLLTSICIMLLALSANAQRVRFEITFTADSPAELSKVYVQPLNIQGEGKTTPMRLSEGKHVGGVPISDSGFYEIVMVINNGQWIAPIYSKETKKITLHMELKEKALVENSTPENKALSEFNVTATNNIRNLWTKQDMTDEELRTLIESYRSTAKTIITSHDFPTAIKQYIKTWSYTSAYGAYTSIPHAQERNPKEIPFSLDDIFPKPQELLDNDMTALFMPGLNLILSEVSVGSSLDEKLSHLFDNYKNGAIRLKVTEHILDRYLKRHDYTNKFDEGLEEIKAASKKFSLQDTYTQEYTKRKVTVKGSPFPQDIKLTDIEGNVVDLLQYKGKYLYIDLWASWCGPCCNEVPYLKHLEKKMKGYDIVFISISTDTDKEAWKEKVKELNLEGIQLLDEEGIFSKSLNVISIPFFLIYDKEGKLHTYGATRPSNAKTKSFLKELK